MTLSLRRPLARAACAVLASTALGGAVFAASYGDWSVPVSAEQGSDPSLNTPFNDGCPILSPDGLSLYMASNRPGGLGGLDIWVAHRASTTSGWGAPENLGAPVNTANNEYCPDPVRGKGLFFVRAPGTSMDGDIYRTRLGDDGWDEPEALPATINGPAQEWSPAFFEDDAGNDVLYFSSTRSGRQAIYESVNYGPARAVDELNAGGDAARPNVRKDGREIVFDSSRAPNLGTGTQDVWSATRESTSAPWSAPIHLVSVSSPANDTRASLSWDGTFLLVGSTRSTSEIGPNGAPSNDIYVSTRSKLKGNER